MRGLAKLATVSALLAFASIAYNQTRIAEEQIKQRVKVVEWQKCTWTSPDGKNSCVGMEFMRIEMGDGTIKGPYVLTPLTPDVVFDEDKWEPIK
jgi:hypothetical protein